MSKGHTPAAPRTGVGYGVVAIFCGVAGSLSQKLLAELPLSQVLVERSLVTAAVLSVWLALNDPSRFLRPIPWSALARALLDAFAGLTFAVAVLELSLSMLTALHLTLPLVTVALAAPLLRERIDRIAWLSILGGFAGVLIVLRPALDVSPLGFSMALLSTLGFALRDIVTRRQALDTPRSIILSMLTLAAAALFLPSADAWTPPAPPHVLLVMISACCQIGASVLLVEAFKRSGVAVISPLRYTSIVWAVLFDLIFWTKHPDMSTTIGIVIVLVAGLLFRRSNST